MGVSVVLKNSNMKYLILTIVLFATSVSSQEVPPFYSVQRCDTFEVVANETKSFGETTLFNGIVNQRMGNQSKTAVTSEFVFSVNQDSGTWSLIALFANRWACTIASGTNFEPYVK